MQEDWVLYEDVPLFDEHDEWDEDKLKTVVDNCNLRIEDTSDFCPVVIGHTSDDGKEEEQPQIVGYATRFSLGTIGKVKPRRCIKANFQVYKDKVDLVKAHPRRSVELWKDSLIIDPIALLGASTPKRDLGLLYRKKSGELAYKYSMNEPTYSMGKDYDNSHEEQFIAEVIKKLKEEACWQWAETMMKKLDQQKLNEAFEDDQQSQAEQVVEQDGMEGSEEGSEGNPEKDNMTDSNKPEDNKPEDKKDDAEKLRHQRDKAVADLARYERQLADTSAQLEALNTKFRRSERERDLIRLENEGIAFDMTDELDFVSKLDDEDFKKHINRMRTRYSRTPVGVNLRVAPVADFGGSREFTKGDMERAVELSITKGVRYEDALASVKSKGN